MYKILSVTIILLITFGEVAPKASHEFSEDQSKIRSKRLMYGHVDEERAPWQVALINEINGFIGSASIITQFWILTSRYCACKEMGETRQDIKWAIAGVNSIKPFLYNNTETLNETMKENHLYFIDKIACGNNHSTYEYHELALLRVNRSFIISDNIKPISVIKRTRTNIGHFDFEVHGWGADDVEEDKWDYVLRNANRRIPTAEKCRERLMEFNDMLLLKDWEICTDPKRWGNACMGDAGNPLTLNNYLFAVYVATSRQKSDFNCDPSQVDIYITLTNNTLTWMERTVSPVKKVEIQLIVKGTQFTAYQFTAVRPDQNSRLRNISSIQYKTGGSSVH